MKNLVEILHAGGHSLVLRTASGSILTFDGRGVSDLHNLCDANGAALRGACIADKVVGVGAAAIMALGGVNSVYADVMSRDAFDLLKKNGVDASCGCEVDQIINRARNGRCPLETRIMQLESPSLDDMWHEIKSFVAELRGGR